MDESRRVVRVSANTLSREVQGETVLLQLDNGEYFGLDEVGTRVWQLIVETGDLDRVRAALFEEYDVDHAVLDADVNRLIEELVTRQLIDVAPSPSATEPVSPRS
jgi:hypothetical protein